MKNHKNFSKYIDGISFDNYVRDYTNKDSCTQMDVLEDDVEENALLIKLSKAISDPRVIQLINSLLINDDWFYLIN